MDVRSKWYVSERKEVPHKSSFGDTAWHVMFGVVFQGCLTDGGAAAEAENRIFGDASPSGQMQMFICNPAAAAEYVPGTYHMFTSHATGEKLNNG